MAFAFPCKLLRLSKLILSRAVKEVDKAKVLKVLNLDLEPEMSATIRYLHHLFIVAALVVVLWLICFASAHKIA